MAGSACVLNDGSERRTGQGGQRIFVGIIVGISVGMIVVTSFALWAGAAPGAGGSSLPMLLPLLLIPVLYLVMIRPQQKRQKQWQEMLSSIKADDRVTTAGGIRGIILSIKDDVIIIRVAPDNIKLEVAKNAIASVTTQDSGQ